MSRGKKSLRSGKEKVGGDFATSRMARKIDTLMEYDEFNLKLLPKLRRMVLDGWDTQRIRKELGPYVQARMAMTALTGNPGNPATLAAQKDILDRDEGTAVQRQETTMRYAKMDKRELQRLMLQKLADAGVIKADYKRIDNVTKKDDEEKE